MNPAIAPAAILIPLGTAFLLPAIARRLRPVVCMFALAVTLAILLAVAEPVFAGQTLVYWMGGWVPRSSLAIGISLSIDAWGLLIALIAGGVGLLTVIYSVGYLRGETGRGPYYVLIMLLITGLIGFSLSGDLFNQFVWLEVFSVAAFALTGFHIEHKQAIEAAFKYLITNSIAAFFIAVGLALLYMQTGALNLAQIARDFRPTPGGLVAVGLMIGGYATKAALVPWHFWLPDAHAVAPAPISALFSGALIKVGVYAVARSALTLFPFRQGSVIQVILMAAAILSMLVGGLQMLHQTQIKRILAFSSVSQIGYIILGIGIGTPLGIAAAAIHTVHHALVKSALFMGAGAVQRKTGIHSLDAGGQLARSMPLTCALMCLGALGLAGIPFLSGYVSKTMLEESALGAGFGWLVPIILLSSILTVAGMVRLLWRLFGPGEGFRAPSEVDEAPFSMWLPTALLVAGSMLLGSLPKAPVSNIAWPAAHALSDRQSYIDDVMKTGTAVSLNGERDIGQNRDHVPEPTDLSHWGMALIVLSGGSGLAFLVLRRPFGAKNPQRVVSVARWVTLVLRHWHTGLVGDYALWNAFGTALLLNVMLLMGRGG